MEKSEVHLQFYTNFLQTIILTIKIESPNQNEKFTNFLFILIYQADMLRKIQEILSKNLDLSMFI